MDRRLVAVLSAAILLGAACSGEAATDAVDSVDRSAVVDEAAEPAPTDGADADVRVAGTAQNDGSEPESESTSDPDPGAEPPADPAGSDEPQAGDDEAATDETTSTDDATDEASEAVAVDLHTAIKAYSFTLWPSQRGDSGESVVALQNRLSEVGIGAGAADGSYGRRTEAAVEAFQRLVGLDPTGDAGAETVAALTDYRYDGLLLRRGDEGDLVEDLQQRLADGPFDPGPIDGTYGTATVQAVWALEKLAGMPTDGDWGPLDEKAWQQLMDGEIGSPERSHDSRWVEVDLSLQVVKVYDPDESIPTLISHASSGSGVPWANEEHSGSSITPKGDFHISRRISGWRESSLNIGRLYNPLYFNGGIAFHGATSVPLYPASHGCVRLPMHIAEYLPAELPNGTAVHVLS